MIEEACALFLCQAEGFGSSFHRAVARSKARLGESVPEITGDGPTVYRARASSRSRHRSHSAKLSQPPLRSMRWMLRDAILRVHLQPPGVYKPSPLTLKVCLWLETCERDPKNVARAPSSSHRVARRAKRAVVPDCVCSTLPSTVLPTCTLRFLTPRFISTI